MSFRADLVVCSKINAAMTKLAEENKDLADQGLEKVLTQLDKVPGMSQRRRVSGAVLLTTPLHFESSHCTPFSQRPCVDPSAIPEAAMSTTACSGMFALPSVFLSPTLRRC